MVSDDDFKEVSKIEFAKYVGKHMLTSNEASATDTGGRAFYKSSDDKFMAIKIDHDGVTTYKILKD
jgi:hypothetical protein